MRYLFIWVAIMSLTRAQVAQPLIADAGVVRIMADPNITAFRRVGILTDGVVHAHVAIHLNITREKMAVSRTTSAVRRLAVNGVATFVVGDATKVGRN